MLPLCPLSSFSNNKVLLPDSMTRRDRESGYSKWQRKDVHTEDCAATKPSIFHASVYDGFGSDVQSTKTDSSILEPLAKVGLYATHRVVCSHGDQS